MPFAQLLAQLRDDRALVYVCREGIRDPGIRGYIGEVSDELVRIEAVTDHIRTDGLIILNLDDITFLRWDTAKMKAWSRVVEVREADKTFDATLDISDWRTLLASLEGTGRLVSLYREKLDGEFCYFTREFSMTYDLIVASHVNSDEGENGSFAIRVEDLTRIDLGGEYETGLKRVLESR